MASSTNSPRKRPRRKASDVIQFLALSVIAGFVTAGLLVPPALAIGNSATASINWFKGLPADISNGPLSQPSTIVSSDGTKLATFYSENRTEVKLSQISKNMINAQLSIEDRDFYQHGGVDGVGIVRALLNNLVNPNARQGASTITQQYVNNLLIDQATDSGGDATATLGANKGIMDKIKEMKLAISMEQNKSKDEILNGYLNIVNYGGSNYGVQAAAQYYWGIDAKDLNIQQSALLAGIVQSPTYYDPTTNPKAAKNRRNTVLYTMYDNGKITKAQYEAALASGLDLNIHTTKAGCTAATNAAYFCNYVEYQILSDEKFGATTDERLAKLNRGGLTIKTTLDLTAQKAAQSQVETTQPIDSNTDKVSTSLVSVQPGTGKILSMAQNSRLSNASGTGNTVYNYNVGIDMGGTGGFQPGSTFKPFTLAEWIKEGNGVNATIDATSLDYPAGTKWRASCVKGGVYSQLADYSFSNDESGFQRAMTVNYGIYNSINSALFSMASYTDLCGIANVIKSMGVTTQDSTGKAVEIKPYENNLAALIGSKEVTPLAMASAFATYASDGMYCTPQAISSVTDRKGAVVEEPKSTCTRALDVNTARGVSYVLKNVLTEGSGYKRGIGLTNASAAKTGTTDNSTQTWMVGYTKGIATASWVGNVDSGSRSLNGLNIGGQSSDYVDGATFAGAQWQNYMNTVKNRYTHGTFTDPSATTQGTGIVSKKAS